MEPETTRRLQEDLSIIETRLSSLTKRFNKLAREDRILPGYGETAEDLKSLHKLAEQVRTALWRSQCVRRSS